MSHDMTLAARHRVPLARRAAALPAVGMARVLITLPPRRLRRVLHHLRRHARPATFEQAAAARRAVVAVSTRCAGQGCLQRSLATVLLCRLRGTWPTWCTGVRTMPFSAHAWVEVAGRPVEEPRSTTGYRATITVPPEEPR